MIEFVRDKTTVRAQVDSGLGWVFYFRSQYENEGVAATVRHRMHDVLSRAVKDARERAYDQGWADAKKKRRRETWFSGTLT